MEKQKRASTVALALLPYPNVKDLRMNCWIAIAGGNRR